MHKGGKMLARMAANGERLKSSKGKSSAMELSDIHWGAGFLWTQRGYEYPLLWGLVMVVIFIRGGHHRSLDKRMSWEF